MATLERTGAHNVGGRQRPVGATALERAVALATLHTLGSGAARYRVGGGEGPVATVFLGVLRLLMLTGCRKNEILTLRWQDVDLNAMELHLADTKTGARTVALSPEAAQVLAGIPRSEPARKRRADYDREVSTETMPPTDPAACIRRPSGSCGAAP